MKDTPMTQPPAASRYSDMKFYPLFVAGAYGERRAFTRLLVNLRPGGKNQEFSSRGAGNQKFNSDVQTPLSFDSSSPLFVVISLSRLHLPLPVIQHLQLPPPPP